MILLSFIFILITGGICFGATLYVATDGNDSNPGTQSLPFETIQKAVDAASNGDTILVEEGTYFEDVIVGKDRLTLRSLTTLGATIDGSSFAIGLTGNGITVEDFTIENSTNGIVVSGDQTEDVTISSNWFSVIEDDGIRFDYNAAIDGCTVTIDDNFIFSSDNYGIYMAGEMGLLQDVDIRILDNLVDGASDGIWFNYLFGGSVEISDNNLYDCYTSGIYIDETEPFGESVSFKIENNTIDLAGTGGSYGIFMNNAERTTWVNGNTVTGGYDSGIHIQHLGLFGSDPLLVYVDENTISGCEWGIYLDRLFEDLSGSIYLRKNVISDCTSGTWGDGDGIHLKYIGYSSAASGFNLYCEENTIFGCDDDGLEFEEIFYGSTGDIEVQRNNFIDNAYGLYIYEETFLENSTLVVENNNFEGQGDLGLYNNTDVLINAQNNWWGDETGPFDPSDTGDNPSYDNPGGLGDQVSEYVDYDPWRDSPYIAGEESSGGCNTGGFDPALIFLILPLLGLFSLKRNR